MTRAAENGPASILIIESHSGLAQQIQNHILGQGTSAVDIGIAGSFREGMNHLCTHGVDIVLMNLTLPDYKGIDAVRAIRMTVPASALVALSTVVHDTRELHAIRAGAHEFLSVASLSPSTLQATMARALVRNERSAKQPLLPRAAQGDCAPVRIVHDLNNAMTSINGFAELLLTRCSMDDPTRASAEQIRRAATRAAALVRALAPPVESNHSSSLIDPASTVQAA